MTKLHRDIAVRLIQCTEDEEFTDQATIKVRFMHTLIIGLSDEAVTVASMYVYIYMYMYMPLHGAWTCPPPYIPSLCNYSRNSRSLNGQYR